MQTSEKTNVRQPAGHCSSLIHVYYFRNVCDAIQVQKYVIYIFAFSETNTKLLTVFSWDTCFSTPRRSTLK